MTANHSTPASVCPCGEFIFPQQIYNVPGLDGVAYRIGDFVTFRYQLLQPLKPETELKSWRPEVEGDLALQLLEWWAYLGDVLTFYNERIANEAYLRTALLPESVNHLVQLLGYRPKPALGAKGTVAALLSPGARLPLTIPPRLQIQSKPGPGQTPQIFELDATTTVTAPDLIAADVDPSSKRLLDEHRSTLWLAGKVSGIKPGTRLLLINAKAITAQTIADYAWINIIAVNPGTDPIGNAITQLSFSKVSGSIAADAQASDYVLLRSQQSSPLWGYSDPPPDQVITSTTMDLAGIARNVTAGSLLLVDVADGAAAAVASGMRKEVEFLNRRHETSAAEKLLLQASQALKDLVPTPIVAQSYSEVVWYANGGKSAPAPPAIAVPHAEIGFKSGSLPGSSWPDIAKKITVRWSFVPVGQLVPVLTADDLTYRGGNAVLVPVPGVASLPTLPAAALLADGNGNAIAATAKPATALDGMAGAILTNIAPQAPPISLASPIKMYFDLMGVSRGKTVPTEVLGSGNPTVAGQDFILAQSPVTYFFDPVSVSGSNFSSTVKVSVNGVEWREVQSFYGQPPNAQVFMLREDDQQKTHVMFGDGVNGALLPTGTNNVVATYRFGAGAVAPGTGTLTVVLTPTPGLKGVANPLQPTGGSDADQPAQLRTLAPRSVLTFNRAVSLDDYAAIALTASGVKQAAASFTFDPVAQRPLVTLWITGDTGAAAAATAALAGTGMPNQGLRIHQATAVRATLSLTYMRDPRYADAAIQTALTAALLDADLGLLGVNAVGIGETVYQSQIAEACLKVQGVTAIQNVELETVDGIRIERLLPRVRRTMLPLRRPVCSGQSYNPGPGKYFSIPNDGQHLFLTGTPTS